MPPAQMNMWPQQSGPKDGARDDDSLVLLVMSSKFKMCPWNAAGAVSDSNFGTAASYDLANQTTR